MSFEEVNCYICQSHDYEVWANENCYRAVKCAKCGLVYLNPRPILEEISEAARTGLHGSLNTVGLYSSKKVKIYAEKLKQIIPKEELEENQIKWLDVGAGFGELIQAVRKISNPYIEIKGIEPCGPKVKRAQSKGIPVEYANLTEINETFSHISLIDIYSHLPNPIESLIGIKRLLNEEGRLILVTGNGGDITRNEYPGPLYLPDHLSFAGESNLYTVLKEAGYEIMSLIKSPYKPIDNPIICFIKNIARKILGKPTLQIKSSKTSRYRSIWIYARVKNTAKPRECKV